jgi:hypothetical protein
MVKGAVNPIKCLKALLYAVLGLVGAIAISFNVAGSALPTSQHWAQFQFSENIASYSVATNLDMLSDNSYGITPMGLGKCVQSPKGYRTLSMMSKGFPEIPRVNTTEGKEVRIGRSLLFILGAFLSPSLRKRKGRPMATKKTRYTTYISRHHLEILNEISERTGRPISSLIGEALDYFLNEKLGLLQDREEPPVDLTYYKEKMKERATS